MFVRIMTCVLVGMGLTVTAHAEGTGFEASDGFLAPSTVPAGWALNGGLISSTNVSSGAQSLELPNYSHATYTANMPLPAGQVTQLSIEICADTHVASKQDNYGSYGHLYVERTDNWRAGGLVLYLNDNDEDWIGTELPEADDYEVRFFTDIYGSQQTVGYFTPGTWYRFTMLIDPDAATITQSLTLLDGTPIASGTYANDATGIGTVRLQSSQWEVSYFDNAYLGEPIPEPAMMGLLGFGSLLMLRRRG